VAQSGRARGIGPGHCLDPWLQGLLAGARRDLATGQMAHQGGRHIDELGDREGRIGRPRPCGRVGQLLFGRNHQFAERDAGLEPVGSNLAAADVDDVVDADLRETIKEERER
jgi:hypothetical protein